MKAHEKLNHSSKILQRIIDAQAKISASDNIIKRAMEVQEKMIHNSNILQRVMDAQAKISASDNIIKRAMEVQEKMIHNSNTLQRVIEAQAKISASDNIIKRAMEVQEKMIYNNNILQRVSEAQAKITANDNIIQRALEAQSKLYNLSLFVNTAEFQNKLFSSKLFDDNLNSTLESTYKSINQNFHQIKNINLSELIKKHKISQITENAYNVTDSSIVAGNTEYSIEEVRNLILDILDESGFTHLQSSLNDSISKMFLLLQRMKNSNQRNFIFSIISTIIISIFSIIITPKLIELSDKAFYQNKKVIIKQIDNLRYEYPDIPIEIVKNLRFVTAKVLNVRYKSSQNSNLVGKLYFGQVVTLISKKKNWSLVEWLDKENSITVKGWVFTRYIKKFK